MDNIDTVITNGKDSINTLEEENQFDLNFVNEEKSLKKSSESPESNTITNDNENNSHYVSDLSSEFSSINLNPKNTAPKVKNFKLSSNSLSTNGKDTINTLEEENQFNLNFVNEEKSLKKSSESPKSNIITNDNENNSHYVSDLPLEISSIDLNYPNYKAPKVKNFQLSSNSLSRNSFDSFTKYGSYSNEYMDTNIQSFQSTHNHLLNCSHVISQSNINEDRGEERTSPFPESKISTPNSLADTSLNLSNNFGEINSHKPFKIINPISILYDKLSVPEFKDINNLHETLEANNIEDSSSTKELVYGRRRKNAIRNFGRKYVSEGTRRKNVIRNFGGKCRTFVANEGNNIAKIFFSKFLKPIGDESMTVLKEVSITTMIFKNWIESLKLNVRSLGKLKEVLIIKDNDTSRDLIFKKTLRVIMLYFIHHKYDEWISSSVQMKDKETLNDYKEDLKILITNPEIFQWSKKS